MKKILAKKDFGFQFKWMCVDSFSSTITSKSYVAKPKNIDDCLELISYSKSNGYTICPKGSGYSYADMILNNKEVLCDLTLMNSLIDWNPDTGVMVIEPGYRLHDALYIGLSDSWTLRACPGGMGITMAGALSSNVHGKDSWKVGNFGDQVIQFKLITSSGEILVVSRENNSELFNAVISGMGLLGIIIEITLQLSKVESPFVEVTTMPSNNLYSTISMLENAKSDSDFSVAWVDSFSKGRNIGRGFVTTAKWIDAPQAMDRKALKASLTKSTKIFDILPSRPTWSLAKPFFGPKSIKIANYANYHHKRYKKRTSYTTLFPLYNFMHNKIPDLESIYKPHGFYEFEPLLPRDNGEENLIKLLELGHKYSSESLLCAIKIHKADDFALSYSLDGYSIGIDIQRKSRKLENIKQYAHKIYNLTKEVGGKIYLSKDELILKELFVGMFENFDDFIRVKNKYDSVGLFQSDMYRRLFL